MKFTPLSSVNILFVHLLFHFEVFKLDSKIWRDRMNLIPVQITIVASSQEKTLNSVIDCI